MRDSCSMPHQPLVYQMSNFYIHHICLDKEIEGMEMAMNANAINDLLRLVTAKTAKKSFTMIHFPCVVSFLDYNTECLPFLMSEPYSVPWV